MDRKCTFSYETEANSSFLVAVLNNPLDLVQYQMRMMENNPIVNLLDVKKYRQDDELRICYNVTSHLTLQQATAGQKMKKEEILAILQGAAETMQELSEYQMFAKGLLLDESYIFVTPGSFKPSFVYLPVYDEDDGMESLREFVKKIVLESRIATTNDNFLQRLLDLINDSSLSPESLAKGVENLGKAPAKKPVPVQPAVPAQPVTPNFVQPVAAPVEEAAAPAPAKQPKGKEVGRSAEPKAKKGKPAKDKKGKKKEAAVKEKSGTSKESLIFTVVQAAAVLGLALLVKNGFFYTESGEWNFSYLAGALIAVLGLDVVLYRELFINSKKEKAPKKSDKKKKAPAKKSSKKKVSAMVPSSVHDKAASVPAAPAAPTAPAAPAAPVVDMGYVPVAAPVPYAPAAAEVNDKTEVIEAEDFVQGYLEYYENGLVMRIHLEDGVTRVGSLAQKVDHVLASHKVSKIHAEFVRQGDACYVRDLNSTNGTFVNGSKQRIVSNQDVLLHNGDRVRLADIEMVFKC